MKFVWSIKYKISSVYNDFIPNQLSSTLNYISYTNSINLRNISYNIISNEQFIYIDSINLTIFDNIYDPDNKAYLSSIDYYVDSITPIIYQNVPIYKNIFTNRVSIYPLNNNNIVDNLNYFNNTISNNTNIVSFNYNNDIITMENNAGIKYACQNRRYDTVKWLYENYNIELDDFWLKYVKF